MRNAFSHRNKHHQLIIQPPRRPLEETTIRGRVRAPHNANEPRPRLIRWMGLILNESRYVKGTQ